MQFKWNSVRAVVVSAIALLCVPIIVSQANAAEVKCVVSFHDACTTGIIAGRIEAGDYSRVVAFFRENHPPPSAVYLRSEGGNVIDAIKIGRLFRKYLIEVEAPNLDGTFDWVIPDKQNFAGCSGSGCVCASACALIWFGGVERLGAVGLHRPQISDPEFKSLPAADAMQTYRQVLDAVAGYLRGMEASQTVISAMTETDSSDITWLDSARDHLERPASFAEWADSTCGKFTTEEDVTLRRLSGRKLHNFFDQFEPEPTNLAHDEAMLWHILTAKWAKHAECQTKLIKGAVEKLGSP